MPNENNSTRDETSYSSGSPPPYSKQLPDNENPNLTKQTEQPDQVTSIQLKILVTSTDNWQSTPYECCCVLENRFVLLGCHEGIRVIDLRNKAETKPKKIIWKRARQMVVIESCRIVLMLTGRSKQVRCYSYDALLRLIYAVLEISWEQRKEKTFDVPSQQAWERISAQCGKTPEEEGTDISSVADSGYNSPKSSGSGLANERLVKHQEIKASPFMADHLSLSSGLTTSFYVCNDIILQDFCYKLPNSRDALSIQIYQTSIYVFAAIRHRDKIALWQRKRDQPLRPFLRLKVFWIPAETKSIAFADDRSILRHILAVFSTEVTAIGLRDSKVQTVPIDPVLERIYQTTWIRDQYEHQLVSPKSPSSPIPNPLSIPTAAISATAPTTGFAGTSLSLQAQPPSGLVHPNNLSIDSVNNNSAPTNVFPTLPANLHIPTIQWTSLIQLPFYPDNLPTTSLTTEYSIPPSYNTVITSLPSSAPPDPVALPSAVTPQLFFATFGKQSYIIDLAGSLFSTQVYRWTETPTHLEFVQLDKKVNDWCVVGFGPETVEIVHIRTAKTVQRVMHGVPVKFLGRWDESVSRGGRGEVLEGKKNMLFKALFWSCLVNNEQTHVYMLKSYPDGNSNNNTSVGSSSSHTCM